MNAKVLASRYKMAKHEQEVAGALALARAILRLEKPQTTRQRLRELKARRKASPDDSYLWAEEHRLRAGQQRVIFNAETREIVTEPNDAHERNSVRTNRQVNAAIAVLIAVWEEWRGEIPSNDDSPAITFIAEALTLAGMEKVPSLEALRRRVDRS